MQQLLASIWYEGLPGFRRKNMVLQALEIVRIGILFPFFSIAYTLAPHSAVGQTMRKPFIKFICHSASYFAFLCKLYRQGGCITDRHQVKHFPIGLSVKQLPRSLSVIQFPIWLGSASPYIGVVLVPAISSHGGSIAV